MIARISLAAALCLSFLVQSNAQDGKKGVWTNPKSDSIPASFAVQGEYVGEIGMRTLVHKRDGHVRGSETIHKFDDIFVLENRRQTKVM